MLTRPDIVDQLRRDGVTRLSPLTSDEITDIRDYFDTKPVWNWHVKAKASEPPVLAPQAIAEHKWPAFCHDMHDVVACPHLFELALSSHPLAKEYFQESPRLYSMNAFWTQPIPDGRVHRDTHGWHRDGDDRKQLVIFVFGTDVTNPENGGHQYQRGTHLLPDPASGPIDTILGPAGTAFAADTNGLHLGIPPRTGPRLLLWARWGVSARPASYDWDQLSPAPRDVLGSRYPKDSELQEAVRLVVA